jgi:hypothetical protein
MLAASEPHGAGTLAVSRPLVGGSGWARAGHLKNDATCSAVHEEVTVVSMSKRLTDYRRAANDSLPFGCHQQTKTIKGVWGSSLDDSILLLMRSLTDSRLLASGR